MAVVDDPEVLEFSVGKVVQQNSSPLCAAGLSFSEGRTTWFRRAATHWAREQLAKLGVEVGTERVVVDRNRMTGGGLRD